GATAAGIGRITPGSTPQITGEFPLLPGDIPQGVASGSDGAIWFTVTTHQHNNQQIGVGQIGRVAPSGQITYMFVPGYNAPDDPYGSLPASIVLGPDGTPWFTEVGGDRIGHITADGQLHELTAAALPLESFLEGIALGPDGNLWFTAYKANTIGR